jgi:hypothetical protein
MIASTVRRMAFTTGTTMFNPYVLNIVDLQNTQNSATGIDTASAVANLGQIVNFTNKSLSADTIFSYTPNSAVSIQAQLNVVNGTTNFSNSDGSATQLFVYGNVYASNYVSLCPLVFKVHDPKGIEVETMRITPEGNVGIGTFAPAERLTVDGGIRNSGNLYVGGTATFDGDVVIRGNLRLKGKIIQDTE